MTVNPDVQDLNRGIDLECTGTNCKIAKPLHIANTGTLLSQHGRIQHGGSYRSVPRPHVNILYWVPPVGQRIQCHNSVYQHNAVR